MKSLLPIGLAVCLLIAGSMVVAAPKPPRPTAGSGVLLVRSIPEVAKLADAPVVLYNEPGIGRLADAQAGSLNLLALVLPAAEDVIPVAVTERRGEWLCIIYDDAGREAWVRQERTWEYFPWEEFLKGKTARMLPALRKSWYRLVLEPRENAESVGSLTPADEFRLIGFEGDWSLVLVGQTKTGWLRWRDRDGRFMLEVRRTGKAQKH